MGLSLDKLGFMETAEFTVRLVRTVDESYPIVLGRRLNSRIVEFLNRSEFAERRIAIITDSVVAELTALSLQRALAPRVAETFVFPAGEASKTRATKEHLEDSLISHGFGRDTVIVAVGGGVVTDLAGFVAATFTRGVPYISVPTTLLGAADASVGGKTAVDTPAATNLIGAFHQPSAVFIDLDYWLTLSDRQIREGLGETIKHGCLADSVFFAELENFFVAEGHSVRDFVAAPIALTTARRNCEIKRDFVTSDVHEGNRRMGLNLGHTIGRALETAAEFRLNHGECVAIGVCLQARLGQIRGYCSAADVERVERLYSRVGLPIALPGDVSIESVMAAMFHDKKNVGGDLRFVFQQGIGALVVHDAGAYATPIAKSEMREFLRAQLGK